MTRCVAILGPAGSGKSTLVDRLAALKGRARAPPAPTETRIAAFDYLGEHWVALNCHSTAEFTQESAYALIAADAAVICAPVE